MDYEASDILGGDLPIAPDGSLSLFAQAQDLARKSLLVSLTSVAFYVVLRMYVKWAEKTRVLKTRRAYGIPDDDHRSFNVALAAVRSERDVAAAARRKQDRTSQDDGGVDVTPLLATQTAQPHLRHHVAQSEDARRQGQAPSAQSSTHLMPGNVQSMVWQSVLPDQTTANPAAPLGDAVPHGFEVHGVARRRHYRDEDDQVAADERWHADEDLYTDDTVDPDAEGDEMDIDETSPHRGAKRSAESEDDEDPTPTSRHARTDKRARKIFRQGFVVEEDTDMSSSEDDFNESTEADVRHRGLKRNRADAGSTIGEGSFSEFMGRRTRRRTISKKSEGTRGQKRGREAEPESEDEFDGPLRKEGSRKKHRKRGLAAVERDLGEYSNDPLCKGKRIGEEWETNGIRYKVGPNGQRLRQELVKKSRSIYRMPSDSQHPDRGANIPVYVEMWLSEEEYNVAKERGELAWQDPPKDLIEGSDFGDIPGSPYSGKSLLYVSLAQPPDGSGPKKGPFKQSMSAGMIGLPADGSRHNSLGRRLSSPYQTPAPASPATEAPAKPPRAPKTYSKWEKQDLEAAAMNRIREKALQAARAEEERKVQEAATKAAATAAARPTPQPAASTSQVSSVVFPKPAEKPAEQSKPPALSFLGAPPAAGASSNGSNPPIVPKLTIPGFSSTQTASEVSKPPKFFATAPVSSSATTSAAPAPSHPAPAAPVTTAAAIASTSASNVPNFFGPKSNTATLAPSSTAPPTNTFEPSSNQASAPPKSPFTFGPPAATSAAPAGDAQKTSQPAQPATGSLLSRLGPAATSQPTSSTSTSTPSWGFNKANGTNFGAAAAPSQPSPFGVAAASTAPAAGPTTSSNTPMFSFGFSGAPSAPAGASTNGIATASPTDVKQATSPFGAAASSSTPSALNTGSSSNPARPNGTSDASGGPKFSFGGPRAPASTSAVGFGSSTAPAAFSATGSSTAGNSATGAPNPAASSKFVFGGPSSSAPTPFGASTNTQSPFGNAAATSSTTAPKPSIAFGSGSSAPASAGNAPAAGSNTAGQKPSFLFNFGAPSASGASGPSSSSSFTFGSKPAEGSNTTSTSTSTPAAFGFGVPSSSTSHNYSPFGAQPTTNGIGAPSAFNVSNPSNTGASNAFGMSAPSPMGSFGFGSSMNFAQKK